jgi:hypothetical protein
MQSDSFFNKFAYSGEFYVLILYYIYPGCARMSLFWKLRTHVSFLKAAARISF